MIDKSEDIMTDESCENHDMWQEDDIYDGDDYNDYLSICGNSSGRRSIASNRECTLNDLSGLNNNLDFDFSHRESRSNKSKDYSEKNEEIKHK